MGCDDAVLDASGLRNLGIPEPFSGPLSVSAAGDGKCGLGVPAGVTAELGEDV